ncbi:HlyD family secretion protein [Streptococcus dentiloxodontae]
MNKKRHYKRKRKGLFRKRELVALALFISSVLLLFALTGSFSVIGLLFKEKNKSVFQEGQEIQISSQASKTSSDKDLSQYHNWIGKVQKINSKEDNEKNVTYTYQVRFENGSKITGVGENELTKVTESKYKKGQILQISKLADKDLDNASLVDYRGEIVTIQEAAPNYSNQDGGYKYNVILDDGRTITNVPESAISDTYHIKLSSENTAEQNNTILKEAFTYAKNNPNTALMLPEGEFSIGSDSPETDYLTLSSDTVLRGNNTTLKVQGSAYWIGFATGTGASDGVRNFTMTGIDFTASDLSAGNQFMIMANHGDNWKISNNSFTMVHKKGSHIFDLGALQNSTFENNEFIGYAPDLTAVTSIPDNAELHDYYAEAIQFDKTDNSGVWDGNIIKNSDANYSAYNQTEHLCNNIVVANNSFLPYKDSSGNIIAYSATIGQHSSDTGVIDVHDNVFESVLTNRYQQTATDWTLQPIHFSDSSEDTVYNNLIQ